MKLTFIKESRGNPLSKHYTFDDHTREFKASNYYQNYKYFDSRQVEVNNIVEFHSALDEAAGAGEALVKGTYLKTLNNAPRAAMADKTLPTQWICLDFDFNGLDDIQDADTLLKPLGMAHVDHIVQYSASHGISPGFRAHIFLMLDHSQEEATIKQWFQYLNLTVPILKDNLSLTAPGTALRWPLDISLAEAHRIIYIAPPVMDSSLDPFRRDGQYGGIPRVRLQRRSSPAVDIQAALRSAKLATVNQLKLDALNEIRQRLGLRKKTVNLKYSASHNTYIAKNPDFVTVTQRREERGFVYLDFAGGTGSMGYYHPDNNFEVIRNFKGEPNYLTRDLAPEYYAECVAARRATSADRQQLDGKDSKNETKYFYFTEKNTGRYWKGTWHSDTDTRILDPAAQRIQINDFCIEHGMDDPSFIPIMATEFNPSSPIFFDPSKKMINLYQPSPVRVKALKAEVENTCPPLIQILLRHVTGDSEEAYARFVNWLAYIWQTGQKPKTAWVLHGTTGTGKGVLLDKVLKPMFGAPQVMEVNVSAMAEQFNGFLRTKQIVMIDEQDTDSTPNVAALNAKMRTYITDPTMTIRDMRATAYEAPSYVGFIITSNMSNVQTIEHNDRRYNVAPRQERELTQKIPFDAIDKIPAEVQAFSNWLIQHPVDRQLVGKPLINEARQIVQSTTSSAPDDVVRALKQGDFRFFVDMLPSGLGNANLSTAAEISVHNYRTVLAHIYESIMNHKSTGKVYKDIRLSRDDISVLFTWTLGWKFDHSPGKFTKVVSKFNLHFKNYRIRGPARRGMSIDWYLNDDDLDVYREVTTPTAPYVPHAGSI